MDDKSWDDLTRELDNWERLGRKAEFWWRDDDAENPETNLRRLIRMSQKHATPISLAVSPALGSPILAEAVHREFHCTILQHGFAHVNHAPATEKKSEYGDHRAIRDVRTELAQGLGQMEQRFGSFFRPVMVPPWNRISPAIVAILGEIGFSGVSGYLARQQKRDQGLVRCNTHVDILNWRENARFVGTGQAITLIINHLTDKRTGVVDALEPTGLLTHHLRHDDDAWAFIDALLARTSVHPAASWRPADSVFSI